MAAKRIIATSFFMGIPPKYIFQFVALLKSAHLAIDYHVIANQCAHWCGNPFSFLHCAFRSTVEDADCHVAALLAMTQNPVNFVYAAVRRYRPFGATIFHY